MRRTPMRRRSARSTPTASVRRPSSMCRAGNWRASTRCSHFATAAASDVSRRRRPVSSVRFAGNCTSTLRSVTGNAAPSFASENAERASEFCERRKRVDRHFERKAVGIGECSPDVVDDAGAELHTNGLVLGKRRLEDQLFDRRRAARNRFRRQRAAVSGDDPRRAGQRNGTGALNCTRIGCSGMHPARALTRSHCTCAVNAGRTWNASF